MESSMSVDLLNQYIDRVRTFERLAETEDDPRLKADLERQADAYRRLAAKCADKLASRRQADQSPS
jgi:hypothetical protein